MQSNILFCLQLSITNGRYSRAEYNEEKEQEVMMHIYLLIVKRCEHDCNKYMHKRSINANARGTHKYECVYGIFIEIINKAQLQESKRIKCCQSIYALHLFRILKMKMKSCLDNPKSLII